MPSTTRVQLQGPRPPTLDVGKDSHQIMKKSIQNPSDSHQIKKKSIHNPSDAPVGRQHPVIVYVHTPKIIHTRPQDFMSLVQRLTGKNTCSSPLQSRDDSKREDVTGKGGNRDPLLLALGQSPTVPSVPSPVSPGFFLRSPNTSACLQDLNLLF